MAEILIPGGGILTEPATSREILVPGAGIASITVAAPPAGGLDIPIAAHHYNHNTGVNL